MANTKVLDLYKKYNVPPPGIDTMMESSQGSSSQSTERGWSDLFANLPQQGFWLGQAINPFIKHPVAGPLTAGTLAGLGKAIPMTAERLEQAGRGETPSYAEQLQTIPRTAVETGKPFFGGMGLAALLSPLRTLGGLREVLGTRQIATAPVSQALQQTKLPLGTGGPGAGRAISEGVSQFGGGRIAQAKDLFRELSELERISRKASGIKETGKALVQQEAAGSLRNLLRLQAPAAATVSKLMQPFIKAQQGLGYIKRAIPYAIGTGAVGALMKALGVF